MTTLRQKTDLCHIFWHKSLIKNFSIFVESIELQFIVLFSEGWFPIDNSFANPYLCIFLITYNNADL